MFKNATIEKALPYLYIILGLIGFIAAFALTYDSIKVLKNPAYIPSCNINPILSCGDIMKTKQADLFFGIPNPIFGLVGFGMLMAFGLALLAGAKFKKWLWLVINVGVLGAFAFFIYLFFQAVFRIHAICPYCFVIWMVTPPLLWYTTLYNLKQGYLPLKYKSLKNWIFKYSNELLVCWYVIVFLILLTKFWYYWKTLL